MLSVRNLTKIYKLGKGKNAKEVLALDDVSIDFPDKGLVFLLGKSGSGKSTLLNTIGGLDTFDSGEIIIKGKSSKSFKQSDFDSYRNTFIGFIFQEYNILDEFSVGKNLALALELQGKKADKEAVEKLLDEVDLGGYYKRKPNQLSGGQKQRVAIARALIKDPEIIMADEPTGALDSNTGRQVMDTLKKLSKTKLVIIVSHDREFAHLYGDRVIELKDGKIINDDTKKEVLAQKSETGVSYIDNKIVHIKKGQKVSKKDYETIIKMIAEKTQESDAIISFDEKTNSEVKRTAFITDEGNREVFADTKPEDIHQTQHDPKDFKLIRSRLKLKDSVKMGASSLKHKPIRLIFTILLACIAFTMFGVVDTMASFSRGSSVYETLKTLNISTVSFLKEYHGSWGESSPKAITDQDIEKLSNKHSDYLFKPVIYGNASSYGSTSYTIGTKGTYYVSDTFNFKSNSGNYYNLDKASVSGVMAINEADRQTLKLQQEFGALPKNDDEVCISHNMYNYIIDHSDLNSWQDFTTNEVYLSCNDLQAKIVGVLKDDTDLSKFTNLDFGDRLDSSSYNAFENLARMYNFGLINMCYITQSNFEKLYASYSGNNYFYTYFTYGDESMSTSQTNILSCKELSDESDLILKNGVNYNNLKDNEIILSYSLARDIGVSNEDAKKGAEIKLGNCYDDKNTTKMICVGISNSYCYVSENTLKDFRGYDYVLTRLKGTTADKTLLNALENAGDYEYGYHAQFESTSIFDNFTSIISSTAKVLLWVGVGMAVFAGLMLLNFIATSITYKKREIGILRAIGARGKDVFSIFFAESFIICLINFALSLVATIVACIVINNVIITQLGINITLLSFGIRQVLLLFGVSFVVALVSSFLPVNKIARKNPIDSINNR